MTARPFGHDLAELGAVHRNEREEGCQVAIELGGGRGLNIFVMVAMVALELYLASLLSH